LRGGAVSAILYKVKTGRGESDAWFNFAEHTVVFSVSVDIHFPKSEALTLSGGNASFFGQKRREDSFS